MRALWTTFRNTQVVYIYSGAWWSFAPALTARAAGAPGLTAPLLVFSVHDQVDRADATAGRQIFGVEMAGNAPTFLRDWELIQKLNTVAPRCGEEPATPTANFSELIEIAKQAFSAELERLAPQFLRPKPMLEVVLLPA